jgi:hypothetical protein
MNRYEFYPSNEVREFISSLPKRTASGTVNRIIQEEIVRLNQEKCPNLPIINAVDISNMPVITVCESNMPVITTRVESNMPVHDISEKSLIKLTPPELSMSFQYPKKEPLFWADIDFLIKKVQELEDTLACVLDRLNL